MSDSLVLLLREAQELLDMDSRVLVSHCELFNELKEVCLSLNKLPTSCGSRETLLELVTAAGIELPDEGGASQGVLLLVLLPLDLKLGLVLG